MSEPTTNAEMINVMNTAIGVMQDGQAQAVAAVAALYSHNTDDNAHGIDDEDSAFSTAIESIVDNAVSEEGSAFSEAVTSAIENLASDGASALSTAINSAVESQANSEDSSLTTTITDIVINIVSEQVADPESDFWDNLPVATDTTAGTVKGSASFAIGTDGTATVPTATETTSGISKLSNAVNSTLTAADGTAASPVAVKTAYDAATAAQATADSAASTASSASTAASSAATAAATAQSAADAAQADATSAASAASSAAAAAATAQSTATAAQTAANAIPSNMTILSTGVGIYRHSSGAGSVIVFGGKQVLVADASYRIGSKTWDAAVTYCAGKTIGGLRCYMPDLDTLRVIWLNRTSIDSYDPTANSNTTKKLSNWGFGSDYVWSRLPYNGDDNYYAWRLRSNGLAYGYKVSVPYGALPCLEL